MPESQAAEKSKVALTTRVRWVLARLDPEQRLAAIGAALLIVSEFLPWYTNDFEIGGGVRTVTQTALQSASYVELALLIIAAAVGLLLFWRAEGHELHLPTSDGTLLTIAGLWSTVLIFLRMLDRPEATINELTLRLGLDWGVFVALAATVTLTTAGLRERRKRTGDLQ